MEPNFALALLLTLLAGLATTIGSLLGIFVREPGPGFMSLTLGFSAGVMILVSFVELLAQGIQAVGFGGALIAFFGGFFAIYVIDVLTPHQYIAEESAEGGGVIHGHSHGDRGHGHPFGPSHEPPPPLNSTQAAGGPKADQAARSKLLRAGTLVAVGIAIHNFPEGMATFASTLASPTLGAAIAVAVAIHNIPEGIAVSVPIYASTGSRRKAFTWSFLSGISEPVGAAIAGSILLPFLSPAVLGITLAAVAGLMIFIALDELLPVSHSFGREHASILGLAGGMAVMALSLYLLK